MIHPGTGRQLDVRKEMKRNQKGKAVGRMKRWRLFVHTAIQNRDDARRIKTRILLHVD
jgi:hypothetical protein